MMRWKIFYYILLFLFISFQLAGEHYNISRIKGKIKLDGVSDEPAWQDVTPLPLVMHTPNFGKAPTEKTEILIAYGCVQFSSKAGTLAGNHFATITSDLEKLREIGVSTLWEGKKSILFKG